jgi:hypothetical protein
MKTTKQLYKTAIHNGPIFPEPYEAKGIKVQGETLSPLAEEMLWNCSRYYPDSDYFDSIFIKNFWGCLKPELPVKLQKAKFPEDFASVMNAFKKETEAKKEAKKLLSKEAKEKIKADKEALKAKYGVAKVDGKDCDMMYVIESPAIIITRGKDPRKGLWKYRVAPEDVRINIVNGPVPPAPKGTSWGAVTNDTSLLGGYSYTIQCGRKELPNSNVLHKMGNFTGTSFLRVGGANQKYDKTANILKHWTKIQKTILDDSVKGDQAALITYLIQMTGIRIGEKNRDLTKFADTKGASSLLKENMSFPANGQVHLDFLGKDSVPYNATVTIDPQIGKILENLWATKNKGQFIFDVEAGDVRKYLAKLGHGITPKNLRTVKCNEILVTNLKSSKVTAKSSTAEKRKALFDANLEIAKTMNHQKNVGKNQKEQELKTEERAKKAVARVKDIEKKGKVQIRKLQDELRAKRALWTGDKLKEKEAALQTKLDMLKARVEKAKESASKAEFNADKKKATKDIALGTSLGSYADPRIIYSWCEELGVDRAIVYSKSMQKCLAFAENTSKNFWRNYPNV